MAYMIVPASRYLPPLGRSAPTVAVQSFLLRPSLCALGRSGRTGIGSSKMISIWIDHTSSIQVDGMSSRQDSLSPG